MSDTKRILPWEHYDEDLWTAESKIEVYSVQQHDYRDGSTGYKATAGNEWPIDIGTFATSDEAIDACESDYIARCSEFLCVAGDGECVVKVEDLDTVCRWIRCDPKRITHAQMDETLDRFTAAIDAAGGGK